MSEKMLKVFISSTYRDLKEIRRLLIEGIEEALDAVAMEAFVPTDVCAHNKSIRELENSDICIFIIGDYYGTIIKDCTMKTPLCNCDGDISFTHCEYRRALQMRKPHLTYVVTSESSGILRGIQEFDLKTNDEKEIYRFLKENGKDYSKVKSLSNYSLEEIEELWKIANDINRKKLEEFKEEVKKLDEAPKLYFPVTVSEKQDYYQFYEKVLNHVKEAVLQWHREGRIRFKKFAGRRKELAEFLQKVHTEKSVCVVGTGGVGNNIGI